MVYLASPQIAEQSQLAPPAAKITRQLIERRADPRSISRPLPGRRAISIVTEASLPRAIGSRHDTTLTLYDLSGKTSLKLYPLPERTEEHWNMRCSTPSPSLLIAVGVKFVLIDRYLGDPAGACRSGRRDSLRTAHIQVENWGLVVGAGKTVSTLHLFVDTISVTGAGGTLLRRQSGFTEGLDSGARSSRGTGAGVHLQRASYLASPNGGTSASGHIQVEPLGERCHCGNFGCLETIARQCGD